MTMMQGVKVVRYRIAKEVVAKLALEAKFDGFLIGLIRRKSIIPWRCRRFAKDQTNQKNADLAPNWSFATTSIARTILLLLATVAIAGWADESSPSFSPDGDEAHVPMGDHLIHPKHRLELDLEYLRTADADLRMHGAHHDHLRFGLGTADLTYTQPINKRAALVFGVGYAQAEIHWKRNPFFHEKEFRRYNASITALTNALDRWFWTIGLGASNQFKEGTGPSTIYNAIFHGRYVCSERTGIHIGFWASTGMRKTLVLPILGVDYRISKHWRLNAVFPEDMAILYTFGEHWSTGLRGRLIRVLNRASENQPLPKAIVEYRSFGVEGLLSFENPNWVGFELFIGSTAGSRLNVYNHKAHHLRRFKFDAAGYAGADFFVNF
jgi:hypothetical protein